MLHERKAYYKELSVICPFKKSWNVLEGWIKSRWQKQHQGRYNFLTWKNTQDNTFAASDDCQARKRSWSSGSLCLWAMLWLQGLKLKACQSGWHCGKKEVRFALSLHCSPFLFPSLTFKAVLFPWENFFFPLHMFRHTFSIFKTCLSAWITQKYARSLVRPLDWTYIKLSSRSHLSVRYMLSTFLSYGNNWSRRTQEEF